MSATYFEMNEELEGLRDGQMHGGKDRSVPDHDEENVNESTLLCTGQFSP